MFFQSIYFVVITFATDAIKFIKLWVRSLLPLIMEIGETIDSICWAIVEDYPTKVSLEIFFRTHRNRQLVRYKLFKLCFRNYI